MILSIVGCVWGRGLMYGRGLHFSAFHYYSNCYSLHMLCNTFYSSTKALYSTTQPMGVQISPISYQ